ncbi:MAG: NAD(P)H-dependent oxidoreductase [Clostridia bacterium]|nr:NAD(P)H-dependent oxidoreductase [Clostridia bacterium]
MKKIIAINASPFSSGNTAWLLEELGKQIQKNGVSFEMFHLGNLLSELTLPYCVCCSSPCNRSCYAGTEFERFMETCIKADGIIFGSPVYFGSMSAQLKCFFDKTRDARARKAFIGKPACAVSVGATKYGGQQSTLRAIQDCCMVLGFSIVTDSDEEFGCGHFGLSAQRPAKEDEYAQKRIPVLANRMCKEVLK